MASLRLAPGIEISESELEFRFVRSSGPGGQNVNKVNSKAVLRWNVVESPGLSPFQRERLLTRLASRLTRAGDILVTSDRYRDQPRNREDCLERLRGILATALHDPRPRRDTQPTRGSERRRRVSKTLTGEKKTLRRKPRGED